MKYCKGLLSALLVLLSCSYLSAQESSFTELNRQFIKGNIAEKAQVINRGAISDACDASELGLDFVISSHPLLGNDRDLASLAVASVLAIPPAKNIRPDQSSRLSDKLLILFKLFDDANVRIAVLSRLGNLCDSSISQIVMFLNGFITSEIKNVKSEEEVFVQTVKLLGDIGDVTSYSIVYELWVNDILSQQASVNDSLIKLSLLYIPLVKEKLLNADIDASHRYFSLLINAPLVTKEQKADIAEAVLEMTCRKPADTQQLQLMALRIISENNWTHASGIVKQYFGVAVQEYNAGIISESDFISVIDSITRLAFVDSSTILNDYLSELNRQTENNSMPSLSVILSVVNSLGILGDKNVFDNLLYTTYLNYPSVVIQASREALSKLKW